MGAVFSVGNLMQCRSSAYQTMQLMEHLDEVDPAARIPWKRPRAGKIHTLSPFQRRCNNHWIDAQTVPHVVCMGLVGACVLSVMGVRDLYVKGELS